MSAATALIGDLFDGQERAGFIGLQSGFMYIGGVVLVLLGGWLAELSWKGPFLVYLTAFVVFLMALHALAGTQSGDGARSSDNQPVSEVAYLPIGLIYLLVFLLMIFYYMVLVQVPFILQGRFGTGSAMTGVAISASALAGSLSSLSFPLIKRRLSYRAVYVLGFGFVAAGYVLIGNAASFWEMLSGLALAGLGNGMLMPNGSFWLMEVAPEQIRGKAVGGFTGMIFLGQFLSPLAMAPVISFFTLNGAFLFAAAAMGMIVLVLLAVPRKVIRTSF